MRCDYCGCKFVEDALGDCVHCSAPSPEGWFIKPVVVAFPEMVAPELSVLERQLSMIKA